MAFDIENWYSNMCSGDVIFQHRGRVSVDLITETLSYTEQTLCETEDNRKLRKKVYNVLVESLQNLYHHAIDVPNNREQDSGVERFAIFALKKDINYNFINGNYILPQNISVVERRLEQINNSNPEQLKKLYQLILNNNKFSEKGGGGLGFVDMARKAGNKYEYSFDKVNENLFFFSLKIVISNG